MYEYEVFVLGARQIIVTKLSQSLDRVALDCRQFSRMVTLIVIFESLRVLRGIYVLGFGGSSPRFRKMGGTGGTKPFALRLRNTIKWSAILFVQLFCYEFLSWIRYTRTSIVIYE